MGNKEKQRLKRQQKHKELRKQKNLSPWQIILERGRLEQCWITGNLQEMGSGVLVFTFRLTSEHMALISFHMDLWCMGVRDVVGDATLSELELRERLQDLQDAAPLQAIDATEARGLLASAIRFAEETGFALPHDCLKLARVAGVAQWQDGDLSRCRRNGEIYYVGRMELLEDRYKGDLGTFLKRDDVHVILQTDGPIPEVDLQRLNAGDKALAQEMHRGVSPLASEAMQWLTGKGITPDPIFPEAAVRFASALGLAGVIDPSDSASVTTAITESLNRYVGSLPSKQERDAAANAIEQFMAWLTASQSTRRLLDAIAQAQDRAARVVCGKEEPGTSDGIRNSGPQLA